MLIDRRLPTGAEEDIHLKDGTQVPEGGPISVRVDDSASDWEFRYIATGEELLHRILAPPDTVNGILALLVAAGDSPVVVRIEATHGDQRYPVALFLPQGITSAMEPLTGHCPFGEVTDTPSRATEPLPTETSQRMVQQLTAAVREFPESHDGQTAFTFELHYSEEPGLSYKTLRDHAFTVTGAGVTGARRLDKPSNLRWEITVTPSSDGRVTIILPVTDDCDVQEAICTEDDRPLSNRTEVTVSGPRE